MRSRQGESCTSSEGIKKVGQPMGRLELDHKGEGKRWYRKGVSGGKLVVAQQGESKAKGNSKEYTKRGIF